MAGERTSQAFAEHRALLQTVAYQVTGTVADAEDVVQEAWLRWAEQDHREVRDVRGFLVVVTTRLALDRLRRMRARRESYVGPWLPEPWFGGPEATDPVVTAESVSMAMLVVLETLSPLERVVFVLHEVFGFEHAEIAAMLGKSPAAVRQLGHRARDHVQARRPRYPANTVQGVTESFLGACRTGDIGSLLRLLAPDVTLTVDTGGQTPGPRRPVRGARPVAALFAASARRIPAGTEFGYTTVNGQAAAIAQVEGVPYAVFVINTDPGTDLITTIFIVTNPGKLTALRRAHDTPR